MEKAFVSGSVVFAVHGSYFIRKPTLQRMPKNGKRG